MQCSIGNRPHSVHRLVCAAFHDNPEEKPCVNHIDGDKHNNTPENLEWVTHLENVRHAIDSLGVCPGSSCRGRKFPKRNPWPNHRRANYKKKCADTLRLIEMLRVSQSELARILGVNRATISQRLKVARANEDNGD